MGEIIQEESGKKGSKTKAKKQSTHIDMTPMVDLMCLLITFFMLTTAFSKPKVMVITMPEPPDKNDTAKSQIKIPEFRTINILISGDNKLYWYTGSLDSKTGPVTPVTKTNYSKDGLRKILLEKNKDVFTQIEELKDKDKKGVLVMADYTVNNKIKEIKKGYKKGLIILIKAGDGAKYRNIVDIVDEMAICNIGSYAIVDMSPKELEIIKTAP